MTSAVLQDLLKCVGALGGLLLLGMFLRAKVKLFQRFLLPASVIGGFAGLLLGPVVLGKYALLPFSEDWIQTWSLLPGLLIIPIFSSTPLGMFREKSKGDDRQKNKTGLKILMTMGIAAAASIFQNVVGFGVNALFTRIDPGSGLYRTFGWELKEGYCGGHGTAGAVGNILEGYGLDYWQTAQGVAMTTATVGLIGGMLLGIFFISRAGKKGQLTYFDTSKSSLPKAVMEGYERDTARQKTLGRETTASSSIETISVHLGIMLGGCVIAFGMRRLLSGIFTIFGSIPVWFYGIVVMYGINYLLQRLELTWLVDQKVKSAITGTMSDFAIVAAIASVPVQAVFAYALPLAVMCALGFVATYYLTFPFFKFCFKHDHPFERAIITWGTNTGVMVTGLMLLKICDPDYKSPSLGDFTMCYPLISLITIAISPLYYHMIGFGSTMENMMFNLICAVVFATIAVGARFVYYRGDTQSQEQQ